MKKREGCLAIHTARAIRNVVIRNPEIQGGDKVGALVGHQAYSSQGIKNCAVIGGKIQGSNRAGGLVGNMEESPIKNCYTTCEVIATDYHAGGIVGAHKVVIEVSKTAMRQEMSADRIAEVSPAGHGT